MTPLCRSWHHALSSSGKLCDTQMLEQQGVVQSATKPGAWVPMQLLLQCMLATVPASQCSSLWTLCRSTIMTARASHIPLSICYRHCCLCIARRDNELKGPAAELKGMKVVGFLAGRTLSNDPGKPQKLFRDCRQHGYGIFVGSGKSLGLGNSRVPHLRLDCSMYKRACGASSCPVRVV